LAVLTAQAAADVDDLTRQLEDARAAAAAQAEALAAALAAAEEGQEALRGKADAAADASRSVVADLRTQLVALQREASTGEEHARAADYAHTQALAAAAAREERLAAELRQAHAVLAEKDSAVAVLRDDVKVTTKGGHHSRGYISHLHSVPTHVPCRRAWKKRRRRKNRR